MDFKTKYLLAKANGLEEQCRGDEISYRMGLKYPISSQIALNMNLWKDLFSGDTSHFPEWKSMEEFREQVKASVDAEIAVIEASLQENHNAL